MSSKEELTEEELAEKRISMTSAVREFVTVAILLSTVAVVLFEYLLSKDQRAAFGGLFLLLVESVPFVHMASFVLSIASMYFLLTADVSRKVAGTAIGLTVASSLLFLLILALMIYISFAIPVSSMYVIAFLAAVIVLVVQAITIAFLFSIRKLLEEGFAALP